MGAALYRTFTLMERITRKYPQTMQEVLKDFIQEEHLSAGHNNQLIFEAWDEASGAGAYSVKRYFREGTLTITLSSSMVRSSLNSRKEAIIKDINDRLTANPLFIRNDRFSHLVTKLVLR